MKIRLLNNNVLGVERTAWHCKKNEFNINSRWASCNDWILPPQSPRNIILQTKFRARFNQFMKK